MNSIIKKKVESLHGLLLGMLTKKPETDVNLIQQLQVTCGSKAPIVIQAGQINIHTEIAQALQVVHEIEQEAPEARGMQDIIYELADMAYAQVPFTSVVRQLKIALIEIGQGRNLSQASIAGALGIDASTMSKFIKRHGIDCETKPLITL